MSSDLVTNLEQLVQEKETQLQALQTRFDELKAESHEYERELELDNEHKDKEIISLNVKLETNSKKLEEYRKEVTYLNTMMDKEKAKCEQLADSLGTCEKKIVSLEHDNAGLENEVRNLKFEKEHLHHKCEKLEELNIIEKEDLHEKFDRKVDTLEKLRQEVLEYKDEIAVLSKFKSQSTMVTPKHAQLSPSNSENDKTSDQIKHLEENIVYYRQEVAKLTEALDLKDTVIKTLEEQVEKMHEELESIAECLRQKEQEEFNEDNELERTRYEIQILRETLEETDKQIQELNHKINVSHDWSRDQIDIMAMEKLDTYTSTKDLEALKKTLKEMGAEIGSLSEKIKYEKEANLKLQRENERVTKEHKQKEKKLTAQKTEITELKNSLTNERSKNADLEKRMTKVTKELDEKNKKITKPATQKDPLKRVNEAEKQGRESRASLLSSEDGNTSQVVEKLETENGILNDKLNKIMKDVEMLSTKMISLHEEKTKLEGDVAERESVIVSLHEKYTENNELMIFVKNLEEENLKLSERLENMLGDVQSLAQTMTVMQADKQRLETEVTQKDSIIDDLAQKLQENVNLVQVVDKLEDENDQLNSKLEKMSQDVQLLSDKFIVLHEEKYKLEVTVIQREATIDGLLRKYQDLEKSIQTYRSDETGQPEPPSPLQSPFKVKNYIKAKEDSPAETDDTFANMKTMTSIDEPFLPNKGIKSFNKSKLGKQLLTSSLGPHDLEASKFDVAARNHTSPDEQSLGSTISRYLHAKIPKNSQTNYIRVENESVYISDNSSKTTRSTNKYLAKGDKVMRFDKIMQKTNDLDLKAFNIDGDKILGKNLFFLIYGTKKTDKKGLKHKLVYEVIEAFNSISQKNPDKQCRIVIRIQDDKFLRKLEAVKNLNALELFKRHQEFTLGEDEKGNTIDDFVMQMKQLDGQLQLSSRSSSLERPTPKEVYIEFMMQNRSEKRGNLSEDRCRTPPIRTKIMITTTNNVKDEKELDEIGSIDSLVDSILFVNRDSHPGEFSDPQRRKLPNSIEKFFILSVVPSMQTYRNVANTLLFGAKLGDFSKMPKMYKSMNERRISYSISSPKFDKGMENFESRVTPTKRERLSNLSVIQNLETPKIYKKTGFLHEQVINSSKTSPSKVYERKDQQQQQQQQQQYRKAETLPTTRRLLKSESFLSKREHEKTFRAPEPDEPCRTAP